MNPFQNTYTERLRSWAELRQKISNMPIEQACVEVDRWWQQVPLVTNHLHWSDTANWMDPWDMLSENTYCLLTRAIGICYTLVMSRTSDVRLVNATDEQCEEHYLVLVDNSKYVLNYWPNSVLSTTLEEFSIIRDISIIPILNKIK